MTTTPITRRKLLGRLLGSGAALVPLVGETAALAKPAHHRARKVHAQNSELDVAVIGGGVAGTYAAWRLKTEHPSLSIRLFETSGRIGGRLRSVAFPQSPHLVAEVGGMRFLDVQKHVTGTIAKLGLPVRPYPVDDPKSRIALRGERITLETAGKQFLPYAIPPSEQDPTSHAFIERLAAIVPDAATMTPNVWKRLRLSVNYKGRALKDWAVWPMLATIFTWEELRFFQDSQGYDDFDLYSSGLAFFDYIFLGDDESKPFSTIVGGYQRLPLSLSQTFAQLGGTVSLRETLVSLKTPSRAGAPFTLAFEDGDGRLASLTAARVILALPKRALNLIPDFASRARFAEGIASVNAVAAAKSLVLYPTPWWTSLGIEAGRSITDQPARQFYVLGSEHVRTAEESASGFGILMSYADAGTVDYWRDIVGAPSTINQGFQWLPGDSELALEIDREARITYGTTTPAPLAACFQDWGADPFGGAWHFWARGQDAYDVAKRMQKPLAQCDLFIVGEAYAPREQGWVEAALATTEEVLQSHFALKKPEWV